MRTAVSALALGLVVGGTGMVRGSAMTPRLLGRIPATARAALTGAAGGITVMLLAGALLVTASLAAHFSTAVNIAEGLHSGVVGGALLAVIGVALVPNAVLYAGAFAAGPGFALGIGTSVAPGNVRLGTVPAFPLLAAVPHGATASWLQGLVVVPVLAGVVAALLAVRRCPATRMHRAALLGGGAGSLTGVAFGAMCQLASGAVGPGRMQHIGPDVVATSGICVTAGALGGAVMAAGMHWVGGFVAERKMASSH
jgi:hypothetical protein